MSKLYPISFRYQCKRARWYSVARGENMEEALANFKARRPGTVSHCITNPEFI